MEDNAALAGDWELWRDFAVRSAGFPVGGLDAFGPGDESGRLRAVAHDPRFREAVTWQNPAALANAVIKVADAAPTKPSRARQREEIVASYWQRYSAKNDTIGFFGPLAWGRVVDDGPALRSRSAGLVRERAVHLESWPVQAMAAAIDPALRIAAGPHSERDLRVALERHPDGAVRANGLAALDRLEAARDRVASADGGSLLAALQALDDVFVELTGREPIRNQGRAYGARTLCYVDCMRDLDVEVGPPLVRGIAPALQVLFEAGRWYCGRVQVIARRMIEDALPAAGRGPFGELLPRLLPAMFALPPELFDEISELQRRLAAVLDGGGAETAGVRAAAAFADWVPAWKQAAFQSVDLQIAARDEADVGDRDWLAVVGDIHVGNAPLIQGVFAHRHPDPDALVARILAAGGAGLPCMIPPFAPGTGFDARGVPRTPAEWIHIATNPEAKAPGEVRTWYPHELEVDGDELVDRGRELRLPLLEVFWLPIFVMAARSFELQPAASHAPRVTIGHTALARESWSVPATELPDKADDVTAFARDRGVPRRVFFKSPLERKPMFLDTESRVLGRILCRLARQAAADSPDARMTFTEMLPGPDECWLADPDGKHYASEFRFVAVDSTALSRRE